MKRIIYELRTLELGGWGLFRRGTKRTALYGPRKAEVEAMARQFCRGIWEHDGLPCQLLIYNKNGRIGTGGRAEASYGADSRRRKG